MTIYHENESEDDTTEDDQTHFRQQEVSWTFSDGILPRLVNQICLRLTFDPEIAVS